MNTQMMSLFQWARVRDSLEAHPAGTTLRFSKPLLPHPREAGARVSVGWPVGQTADFRFDAESDCRGMHVHEFADRWEVHLDQVHPACSMVEHIKRDAPNAVNVGVTMLGGAVLGGALGAAMGNKRESVMLGAGLGLLCAGLLAGSKGPRG